MRDVLKPDDLTKMFQKFKESISEEPRPIRFVISRKDYEIVKPFFEKENPGKDFDEYLKSICFEVVEPIVEHLEFPKIDDLSKGNERRRYNRKRWPRK